MWRITLTLNRPRGGVLDKERQCGWWWWGGGSNHKHVDPNNTDNLVNTAEAIAPPTANIPQPLSLLHTNITSETQNQKWVCETFSYIVFSTDVIMHWSNRVRIMKCLCNYSLSGTFSHLTVQLQFGGQKMQVSSQGLDRKDDITNRPTSEPKQSDTKHRNRTKHLRVISEVLWLHNAALCSVVSN